ncbi:MAG: AbrB/MazE/SpoVT family DNA-binding domain-containing protein [Longimicrobiales bacterium]
MDRSGRVVIPQSVRERYGLVNDSYRLEVRETAEGIVLRPSPEEIPAERHPTGWVVFRSGGEAVVDPVRAVEEERERRHRRVRDEG